MSLKPKKHSDIKKIKEKMKVKASKMDTLHELPPYTMIVSEGIKTEPSYLKGFVKKLMINIKISAKNRTYRFMELQEILKVY